MSNRQLFTENEPDIRIHIADNGWLVYAYDYQFLSGRTDSRRAVVFNTAEALGEYITRTAKAFEVEREERRAKP